MSYQDPYTGQNVRYHDGYQHGGGFGEFNPYTNTNTNPKANAYNDYQTPQSSPFPGHAPSNSVSDPFASYSDYPRQSFPAQEAGQHRRNDSAQQENVYFDPGDNSFKNIKDYRSHYQGNMWTKGSRFGCFGRFFCCTFLVTVYLFLSIVAALALWLRPPSVEIGDPGLSTSNQLNVGGSGLTIPLELNITVNNPTYLSVEVSDLTVDLTYPVNNIGIGNGTVSHVNLHSNAETNFTLPIDIDFAFSGDGLTVLADIAQRCGLTGGGSQSGLSVDADIHIRLRALSAPIRFTVSRTLNFDCPPFDQGQIQDIINTLGDLIGSVASSLK